MIAIAGASGFVGSHVLRAAVAAGEEVAGLVRSERSAERVRQAGGRPIALTPDAAALARELTGCRAVVHLAQIGREARGASYDDVNVAFTARLVDAARQAGVARFVLFSGLGVARYGQARRATNRYFLSKLRAEALVLASGLEAVVFRPSYVVGPGDSFVPPLLAAMADGEVDLPGDGGYRMQPIAVEDAAAAVLAALARPAGAFPTVFDLVGPEPIAYAGLLERLATVARRGGRRLELRTRPVPLAEADRRAREDGFHGMGPDELDCLLCDEIADPAPLEQLVGRGLTPLDAALAAALPRATGGA